jgi:hypothetical protein
MGVKNEKRRVKKSVLAGSNRTLSQKMLKRRGLKWDGEEWTLHASPIGNMDLISTVFSGEQESKLTLYQTGLDRGRSSGNRSAKKKS